MPLLECALPICFKILTLDSFHWIEKQQLTGLSLVKTQYLWLQPKVCLIHMGTVKD